MEPSSVEKCDEESLAAIELELKQVSIEIHKLTDRKNELITLRDTLKDRMNLEKSKQLADKDWDKTDFPWHNKLVNALRETFKIQNFRPHQLATINVTLSKQDAILIMPTGGGKSLTYQLPAIIDKGFTLVVSPLLSLMEDQVIALKTLDIDAGMFHAQSDKTETNRLMQALTDMKSPLKIIYATPEKLAKSKRFMSKLQKAYEMGRLARIAIDEVHCCSQWGHDFRPDYKFLGVLKPMFPEVPILGLTATATSKITIDVQKMLNIQGCIVFKATFNRPNLFYELRPKTSVLSECVDQLVDLLKNRYANQSGIIYTTSIKDCDELRDQLRQRGLRVSGYHATLDAALRSKIHRKWLSGDYQAVVATIAFGLGIDKPDVRFVIHHALSKSMENFYQESGRAGRDGKPADCILFYRLADVFKLSTMVFTQQTGLPCLYGMLEYCIDVHRCRREMIASHFDEVWDSADCNKMCDHCRASCTPKFVDITKHCHTVYKLFAQAAASDTKLTAQKLLDAWYGKGPPALKLTGVSSPSFPRETAEHILAYLLISGYIKEDFHFTPYSTISYIRRGPMAHKLDDSCHTISMAIRGKRISEDDSKEKTPTNSSPRISKDNSEKKAPVEKSSTKISNSSKRKRLEEGNKSEKRKIYLINSDSD